MNLRYYLSLLKPNRENLKYIIFVLLMVALGIILLGFYYSPDPTIERVEPTLFWNVGSMLTIVIGRFPSGIPIWMLVGLYFIDTWIKARTKPRLSSKERISRLESKVLELKNTIRDKERMRRFEQSNSHRSLEKTLYLIGVVNLFKERVCPNCLAEIEKYVELEALV